MKKILFAVIALFSLSGCSFNRPNVPDEPIMQVAGKTFYEEGCDQAYITYFKFTEDSVFYRQISYFDSGTYEQKKDIVYIKRNSIKSTLHAWVKEDMIMHAGKFYTQDYPEY